MPSPDNRVPLHPRVRVGGILVVLGVLMVVMPILLVRALPPDGPLLGIIDFAGMLLIAVGIGIIQEAQAAEDREHPEASKAVQKTKKNPEGARG